MLEIADYVYRRFPEAKLSGNDYHVNCPFCLYNVKSEDMKAHLYISDIKQTCHCFRCGYASSWIYLVMELEGLPYHAAMAELYRIPKLKHFNDINEMLHKQAKSVKTKVATLPEDFMELYGDKSEDALPYRAYLKRRGIKAHILNLYGIGYAPVSQALRVVIPIEQGYWQARAIKSWMAPKYKNPEVPARDILFNANALQLYEEVVVCEGAFSAMAVGGNAIALISKEPTQERVDRILASDVATFIIALEKNAFGTMGKLLDAMIANGRKVIVWNYSVGDPADMHGKFEEIEYNTRTKVALLLA